MIQVNDLLDRQPAEYGWVELPKQLQDERKLPECVKTLYNSSRELPLYLHPDNTRIYVEVFRHKGVLYMIRHPEPKDW
jgi:hypothetical protein